MNAPDAPLTNVHCIMRETEDPVVEGGVTRMGFKECCYCIGHSWLFKDNENVTTVDGIMFYS